jgi:hypothetical protein
MTSRRRCCLKSQNRFVLLVIGQELRARSRGCSRRRGSRRLLVAAAFLSQHRRVATPPIAIRRDCGQAPAEAFERVLPHPGARERIKAEDLAITGGKNSPVQQDDVDEIRAFEMRRPHLLTGGAIQRDD